MFRSPARRAAWPLVTAATAAFILWSGGGAATQSEFKPAAVVPCNVSFVSPRFVPVAGLFGAVVIDDACEHVYLTNLNENRVEDFSLRTLTFLSPIAVGARPVGLDFRPGTNLLYVANSEGSSISVVDLAQRQEIRRIALPPFWAARSPYSIAIPGNGIALFSTRHHGSTGGEMMQLNLDTEQATLRSDFNPPFSGSAGDRTRLKPSGNRNAVAIVVGGNSGGVITRYDAATNSFAQRHLQTFIKNVTVDSTGSVFVAVGGFGAYVLDSAVNLSGTVELQEHDWGGSEVSPDGRVGYRSLGPKIDVMNLVTFLKMRELPVGDTLDNAYFDNSGYMDLSGDGRLLAVITDHGISLVRTEPPAFTDDPLVSRATPLRAVHITEVRTRIDAQRVRFGLPPFAWTNPAPGGVTARAVHVSEMRTALQQAYSSAGRTPPAFAEPLVAGATSVRALHISELRAAVLDLETN